MRGGYEHLGWGADRHLRADIFDAVMTNTRATGNFKKPPKIDPHYRPKSQSSERPAKPKRTLKEIHAALSSPSRR